MTPQDLLYSPTHEWTRVSTDESGAKLATVGITDFAVEALTDLVYMQLPEVGRQVTAGDSFGEIESVKAVSDLYAPVGGEVVEVNSGLPDSLEVLNQDAYGKGWIAIIRIGNEGDLANLLDHEAYQRQCAEEGEH